jgi:hypothetical protein
MGPVFLDVPQLQQSAAALAQGGSAQDDQRARNLPVPLEDMRRLSHGYSLKVWIVKARVEATSVCVFSIKVRSSSRTPGAHAAVVTRLLSEGKAPSTKFGA